MPFAIDQEALDSPSLKILDINKPPTRNVPHQEYPKMVYLHPKEKTKEHRTKIVKDAEELEDAEAKGWKAKPHIPVAVVEDLSVEFEAETPEEFKRGPGRPKSAS